MFDPEEGQDVRTELLEHPGLQKTLKSLSGFANRSKSSTRFSKAALSVPLEGPEDPVQEAVTFPAEGHNPFPAVNIGEIRKGYINFLKRPIDLEEEIAQDHKVRET